MTAAPRIRNTIFLSIQATARAIDDALNGLRMLEKEDEQERADEQRIAETALERLRVIGPKLASD